MTANRRKSPHVVIILADDMGIGDLECYNPDSRIPTPNMNELARQGLRLTDAHAPSAVCTPSRYGLLTGQYCWRTRLKQGVLGGFDPPLIDSGVPTIANVLSQAGYRTACVGKWHLGLGWTTRDRRHADWPDKVCETGEPPHAYGWNIDFEKGFTDGPVDRGFDSFFGIASSNSMYPYCFLEGRNTVGIPDQHKDPVRIQQRDSPTVADWDDYTIGLRFTERAVSVIDSHARDNPDAPLFLYFASEAPHRPCLPAEQFAGRSDAGRRGDMVYAFDWYVGQVVESLKRNGMYDDTLLIVTSDNGARPGDEDGETYGHRSNGIYRGYKMHIWDGGHRIPFLMSRPGVVKAGSTSDELLVFTDILPTLAELVGGDGGTADGRSFLSVLGVTGAGAEAGLTRPEAGSAHPTGAAAESRVHPTGAAAESRAGRPPAVIHHSYYGMFSVRRGRWKYIEQLGSGGSAKPGRVIPKGADPADWPPLLVPHPNAPAGQLYNMIEDPQERRNLWSERPDVVAELHAELERVRGDDAVPMSEGVLPLGERPRRR